jgi:hypothetical protein
LTEAKELVSKLREKAGKKSKLLADKQAEADKALAAITTSMTVNLVLDIRYYIFVL